MRAVLGGGGGSWGMTSLILSANMHKKAPPPFVANLTTYPPQMASKFSYILKCLKAVLRIITVVYQVCHKVLKQMFCHCLSAYFPPQLHIGNNICQNVIWRTLKFQVHLFQMALVITQVVISSLYNAKVTYWVI